MKTDLKLLIRVNPPDPPNPRSKEPRSRGAVPISKAYGNRSRKSLRPKFDDRVPDGYGHAGVADLGDGFARAIHIDATRPRGGPRSAVGDSPERTDICGE